MVRSFFLIDTKASQRGDRADVPTADAESNERKAGRTAGVDAGEIWSGGRVRAERLDEGSGRSEPVEQDECRRNNNPVERYGAERQDRSYKDERDAGDGNRLTAASHLSIVPPCSFNAESCARIDMRARRAGRKRARRVVPRSPRGTIGHLDAEVVDLALQRGVLVGGITDAAAPVVLRRPQSILEPVAEATAAKPGLKHRVVDRVCVGQVSEHLVVPVGLR